MESDRSWIGPGRTLESGFGWREDGKRPPPRSGLARFSFFIFLINIFERALDKSRLGSGLIRVA